MVHLPSDPAVASAGRRAWRGRRARTSRGRRGRRPARRRTASRRRSPRSRSASSTPKARPWALGHGALEQRAARDDEQAVARAGGGEADQRERQPGRDGAAQQAAGRARRSPPGRARPGPSSRLPSSDRRASRGVGADQQPEAAAADVQLVRASTSSATFVAPQVSSTAPEVKISGATPGGAGRPLGGLVGSSAAGRRAAQAGEHAAAEAANVTAFRTSTSCGPASSRSPAAQAGPASCPSSRTAPNSALAAPGARCRHDGGQQGARRGAQQRAPEPGEQGERDQRHDARHEGQRGEGERADHVGGDRAAEPARPIDQPAQQRAEQHRRREVGEQDCGRAPGGAEAVVGQHEQRHVRGAGAERALQVRGEEPARRAPGLCHQYPITARMSGGPAKSR